MLWLSFLLIAAFVIGYLVWDFRKKTAAREAASSQRLEELLRVQTSASRHGAAPAPVSAAPPPTAAAGAPAAAPAAGAGMPARERFLGQRETLLYLLLKTGLSDHDIFANVSLASLVALPAGGGQREQQLRRLAPYQIDFVVCDKSMRIVAAIDMDAGGPAGEQQFKADCLKQAGIRLIRVNPAAMPKRDQVRALIAGAPTPGPA